MRSCTLRSERNNPWICSFEDGGSVRANQFDEANPGFFRRLLIIKRRHAQFKRQRGKFVATVQIINEAMIRWRRRKKLLSARRQVQTDNADRKQNSGWRIRLSYGHCYEFAIKEMPVCDCWASNACRQAKAQARLCKVKAGGLVIEPQSTCRIPGVTK